MKKLTRKLFISVLVAVFAFVALGTSTYAWITLSTAAEVTAITATVDAGEAGIELSETGAEGTWTTVLTLSKTLYEGLDDVTTDDGKVFYDFVSSVDGGNNIMSKGATPVEASTGKFVEKTIKIRKSLGSEGDISVRVNGAKVAFAHIGETSLGAYTFGEDPNEVTATTLFAANAARLSVTIGDKTAIYEQAGDELTTESTNFTANTVGYSQYGFAHKYAAYQNITLVGPQMTYDALEATEEDSATLVTLTDLAPEATITFRIWIEGWDNECHANILKQSFSVAFGFEKAE